MINQPNVGATIWPTHISLTLEHNPNATNYETVQEWDARQGEDWVSDAERAEAFRTQSCWVLQWYPITPVGCCVLAAHSLDALLAAAVEP